MADGFCITARAGILMHIPPLIEWDSGSGEGL